LSADASVTSARVPADRARNLENIKMVLRQPIKMFDLGHGGPVTRESVIAGFATGSN